MTRITDVRSGVERDFIYDYTPVSPDVEIAELHPVVAGERLDTIAFAKSGYSDLWWVLADVNEIHGFPLFLPIGTLLKIPVAEVFSRARAGSR